MSFWEELTRRRVFRAALAYLAGAWLLLQVASVVLPTFQAPPWMMRGLIYVSALAFPVVLILAWIYDWTPGGLRATAGEASDAPRPVPRPRFAFAIIAVLSLALAILVADNYLLDDARSGTRGVLANSIAVLPFANLSPNPDDAFFADGIHEEVLNELAKLGSLNVIARTSVLRYADGQTPIPEIASDLSVETVMEGSVRYAGDRVRISAQLINAATGAHLWSEIYERDLADIFAIQADIAMNIANALQAEFSDAEQERLENAPLASPEAYALYLRAWAAWGVDRDDVDAYLSRAIELDPAFARAYALRASNYSQMMISTFGAADPDRSPEELYRLVQEAVERALELDPTLGRAYGALAVAHRNYWRWTRAKEAIDRGRRIDPSFLGDAWSYTYFGELDLARRSAERYMTLNPNDPFSYYYSGVTHLYAGRSSESVQALQRAVSLEPDSARYRLLLAKTYLRHGDRTRALEELRIARELFGEGIPVAFGTDVAYTYALLGMQAEAASLIDAYDGTAFRRQNTGTAVKAALATGDLSEALRWLNVAVEKARNHEPDVGFYSLMAIKLNDIADPVLERPEFVAARERLTGD